MLEKSLGCYYQVYLLLCVAGECKAADLYAEQLEETIRYTVPKGKLAAFFAEPIQVSL